MRGDERKGVAVQVELGTDAALVGGETAEAHAVALDAALGAPGEQVGLDEDAEVGSADGAVCQECERGAEVGADVSEPFGFGAREEGSIVTAFLGGDGVDVLSWRQ